MIELMEAFQSCMAASIKQLEKIHAEVGIVCPVCHAPQPSQLDIGGADGYNGLLVVCQRCGFHMKFSVAVLALNSDEGKRRAE